MIKYCPKPIALYGFLLAASLLLLAGCNGSGDSATADTATGSSVASGVAVPAAPANLAGTAGNAQVSLTWSASSTATSYDVKRSTISGGPYSQIASVTSTSYTDATVTNGTVYHYVVCAVNAAGDSADSADAAVTPDPTITTPAVPMGLAATPGNAQVSLTWSASSGATGYHVRRATTSGGPYTQIAAPTSTSYTDTSVTNGTTYFYVVSALDSAGESANSAQASALPAALTAIPAAPTGLSATPGNGSVDLTWSASSGAASYNVKRGTASGGPYTQIMALSSTSYTDGSVNNGATYYYVVTAVNSAGESGNSAPVRASPVAPPVASITVNPTTATVSPNGTFPFSAVITASPGTIVRWSMQETGNVGTVASNGLYTAPSVAGTYHVVATSSANSNVTAVATVTVAASPGTVPALTPGVWTNITPPAPGLASTYGVAGFAITPSNPNIIYACTDTLGLWKTTDRGTTWTRLGDYSKAYNNGTTSTYLDSPIAVAVDPGNPNHIVATDGVRGQTLGFWVSQDGGVTWTMPAAFATLAASTTTRDVTQLSIDPSNFNHILVGSHSPWQGLPNGGVMETKDGGNTWTAHAPVSSWSSGSLALNFLYDIPSGQGNANTWLVGDWVSDGMWRTTDAGASWTQVTKFSGSHGGGSVNYTPSGTVYAGSTPYPVYSNDNGLTWSQVNSTGIANSYYYVVVGDGTTLYTMQSSPIIGGYTTTCFVVTPESTGTTSAWSQYQGCAQTFNNGPFLMRYDAVNGIMYSANWGAGFWALKVIKP